MYYHMRATSLIPVVAIKQPTDVQRVPGGVLGYISYGEVRMRPNFETRKKSLGRGSWGRFLLGAQMFSLSYACDIINIKTFLVLMHQPIPAVPIPPPSGQ